MYGLTDRSHKELLEILSSIPEIEEVLIYGSRARGGFWRASDVAIKNQNFKNNVDRDGKVIYRRAGI